MSIHHYIGGTVWTSGGTEVTVEFPTVPELTTAARGGEGGSGSVIVTDPTGTLDLRGWNRYRAEETACTTRPLIYPGFVKGKKIRRGAEGPRGVGRVWECELGDLNLLAHLVAFKTNDANRPAETFAARIAWFLASSVVSGLFSDTGYVITGHDSVALDAADYRRRYPDDVTGDIASQTGWDSFIFWDYTAAAPGLFLNLRDVAILTSTLSISNFAGEANDTTIFSSGHSSETEDAVLERDPDETYSGIDLYWVGGETHRTSATTAAAYIERSFVYESTRIGRATTAATIADQFILDHAIEQDMLTIPVRLPKSLVNMIQAGERIAVHLEHLHFASGTDYGGAGYTYVRVARRTVSQAELDFYDLTLTCTNFVKAALGGGGGTGGFPHQPPGPAIHFFSGSYDYTSENYGSSDSGSVTPGSNTTSSQLGDVNKDFPAGDYTYDVTITPDPLDAPNTGQWGLMSDDGTATWLTPHLSSLGTTAGVSHTTGSFTVTLGYTAAMLTSNWAGTSHVPKTTHLTFIIDPVGWDDGTTVTTPESGQWTIWTTVTMTGATGTTAFPYATGSLEIKVDGVLISPASYTETDNATGAFTLDWSPDVDEVVTVRYQGI